MRCFEIADSSFAEPAGHLRRVVGVAHLDPLGCLGGRRIEPRPSEGEVLEREPQRLGVRELALEQVEARLERSELVVGELELRQEVALRAEGVQLLAGELVALRVERHAEADQLGAVGVEAAREGFVGHLRVALDVLLDVARRQRSPLGHQEGDERELADQLVGVVGHRGALFCPIALGSPSSRGHCGRCKATAERAYGRPRAWIVFSAEGNFGAEFVTASAGR